MERRRRREREKKTVKSSSSRFLRQMFRSAKKNFGVGLFFAETLVGHRSGRTEIHQMIMSSRGLKMIHLFRRRNEKSGDRRPDFSAMGELFRGWAPRFQFLSRLRTYITLLKKAQLESI